VQAPVPQPAGWPTAGPAALAVASEGTAFVTTTGYDPAAPGVAPVAIATRAPAGGWSFELVPSDWGFNPVPHLVAGPGGDLGLLYHLNGGGPFEIRYKERRGGSWSAPEDVGPTAFSQLGVAASADLSRVIAWGSPGDLLAGDLVLYSRGAAGWTGATLASGEFYVPVLGVLAGGRAWIATMPNAPGGPAQPWSLWEEP
jgi:hypothetical protein